MPLIPCIPPHVDTNVGPAEDCPWAIPDVKTAKLREMNVFCEQPQSMPCRANSPSWLKHKVLLQYKAQKTQVVVEALLCHPREVRLKFRKARGRISCPSACEPITAATSSVNVFLVDNT